MKRFGIEGRGQLRLRAEKGTTSTIWIRSCLVALAAQIALHGAATAQPAQAGPSGPPFMDRQREIALALSACPPAIASKAAVYVLDKTGYVKVRDSENGFTAIIQHSTPAMNEPQCIDAEGSRTYLQRYLKVAEW